MRPAERPTPNIVSDPAKPVPYRRRPIRPVYASDSTWSQWLTDDQRDVSTRPDVLTYVSAPLTAPLTISGDVAATLMASTTGSDADWVVKLIDVYPAGDARSAGTRRLRADDLGRHHARPLS